jgi:hypothetical protein
MAFDYANDALSQLHLPPTSSMSQSSITKAGAEEEMSWSANPDAQGWYSASISKDGNSATFKIRYLASTGTIEFELSSTGKDDGGNSLTATLFTHKTKP